MTHLNLVLNVFLGCISLVTGLHAIIFRRIEVGEDEEVWYFGWRAVLVGVICVGVAFAIFFGLASHQPIQFF